MQKKSVYGAVAAAVVLVGGIYLYRHNSKPVQNHHSTTPVQSAVPPTTTATPVNPAANAAASQTPGELAVKAWSPPKEAHLTNAEVELRFIHKKYHLSDQQIAEFNKKGFNSIAIIKLHELSKMSKKSVNDLVSQRMKNHAGWGKFTHDMGVVPFKLNQKVRTDLEAFAKAERPAVKPPEGMLNPKPAKKIQK